MDIADRFASKIMNARRFGLISLGFIRIGSTYGGWWISPGHLNRSSRIISAGVGEDTSFDMHLIETYGCQVLALDPTPKAITHMSNIIHKPFLSFQPIALAKYDGCIYLAAPEDRNHASWHVIGEDHPNKLAPYPAESLSTILEENGWDSVDLLKMDIEGSEYDVIEHIIEHNLIVKQLCVEFHDNLARLVGKSTASTLRSLRNYGMRLAFRENDNYTFLMA